MARVKVYVTDTLPPEAKSVLDGYDLFEGAADEKVLEECRALVCWPTRAKPDLFQKMKSLEMVQTMSAGVDALDFRSLPKGVQVFSNAGAFTATVAEHAWGILLGVAKGVHLRNKKVTPRALRGKTLLVLGAGAIGSEVARLSKSLEMKTIGISRSLKTPQIFDEAGPVSSLAAKIGEADTIVIALPLTKATKGLVDYDILMEAKDAAIVVNVGRGEIVSEDGLIRWLKERPESRYGTDVFWKVEGRESFETKAWELPNFAGTLHDAGVPLGEDLVEVKVAAAWNVKRFFDLGGAVNRVEIGEYL